MTEPRRRLRLSVVVPTWNREQSMLRCLHALAGQSRPADEVLVVLRGDDLATEEILATADLPAGPPRVVRVTAPGQVAALNAGLAAASGEVVVLTDDDSAPRRDWLRSIEAHFLRDREIGAVGGRDWVWSDGEVDEASARVVGRLQWFGRLIGNHHRGVGAPRQVDVLKGVNMSFRATAVIGLRFDDRLIGDGAQVFNDAAFSLAVRRAGWKLVYDPEVAVDHYPAARPDDPRGGLVPLSSITDAAHNETVTLLRHLSPPRRLAYLLWAFGIGTRGQPGLLQALRAAAGGRDRTGAELRACLSGRKMGFREWRRSGPPQVGSTAMTAAGRLARERDFHDELAAELNPERMPPPTPGELDRTFLDQIGDVQGKDVLDLGCGTGDLTLDLAAAGAEVTGLDLSPGMVAVAERRLAEFLPDRSARFVAAVAEESGLPTASFDLVVGRYVIHHLDASEGAAEIHRLLRPGGRAVFLETWGGNPVLMFARRHLAGRFGIPRYGTEDEHPLTDDEVGTMARHFERASAEHPTFEFFRIFDRQVLRFRFTWASRLLTGIDRFMFRFPALRRFSFRVLLTFEK